MSQRVRVVRIIEIDYPTVESYFSAASYWVLPGVGVKDFGDKTYRSTMMGPFVAFGEEVEDESDA